jgi:hypothetical protein
VPDSQSVPGRLSASQTSWSAPFSGVISMARVMGLVAMNFISRLSDSVAKLVATLPGWKAAAEMPWAWYRRCS